MKITEVRKKKLDKKEELKRIGNEFKEIKSIQWLRFSIFIVFIVLIVLLLVFINENNKDNEFVISENCNKTKDCVGRCLDFYERDDINHSLECNYKCLTYKYCES